VVGEVGEHLQARAMLRVGWMGPEEHQRRRSTVAGAWWRWWARVEWRELDGNCGESSDRLLFRTEGEGVRCREWKWRLVGRVGREVAGGCAAVAHMGPASGHQLGALHTGWQLHVQHVERRWRLIGSGRQLGGDGHDQDAVRTRAGRGWFERLVL
jgi:hypothetical protein